MDIFVTIGKDSCHTGRFGTLVPPPSGVGQKLKPGLADNWATPHSLKNHRVWSQTAALTHIAQVCKAYLVPEPTATTVASIPFFWPFSGIRIPPLDFVSAAIRYKLLENYYFWQLKLIFIQTSVADSGCLSRIPDPNFSIPDPGSEFFSIPNPGSASKKLSIITQKLFLIFRKHDPG
jgi:hypothetical protein